MVVSGTYIKVCPDGGTGWPPPSYFLKSLFCHHLIITINTAAPRCINPTLQNFVTRCYVRRRILLSPKKSGIWALERHELVLHCVGVPVRVAHIYDNPVSPRCTGQEDVGADPRCRG